MACFDFVLDAVAWICCQFKGAAEVVVRPGEPGGGRRERGRDGCQRGCRYGARAGGGDDGWLGLLQQPLHGLAVGLVGAPPAASAPRAVPPPAAAAVAPSLRRPRLAAAAGEFGFAGGAAPAAGSPAAGGFVGGAAHAGRRNLAARGSVVEGEIWVRDSFTVCDLYY